MQPLLDAIVDFLPSPLDIPPVKGTKPDTDEEIERKASDDEPFCALAFKIMADPFVGKLAFFRVYSGTLPVRQLCIQLHIRASASAWAASCRMHANHREEIDEVYAGDIAAAVGLKETTTGDTLCDEKQPDRAGIDGVPGAGYPRRHRAEDQGRSGQDEPGADPSLAEEDPTFKTYTDEATGQTIIAGMGELHLEIIVDRLLREFKRGGRLSASRRSRTRSAIRKRAKGEGTLCPSDRRSWSVRSLRDRDLTRASPVPAMNSTTRSSAASFPKEFIAPIDQGIREAAQSGILGGYEVVDFKRRRWSTALTTTSTPPKWRSRSPAPWPSRRRCQKADCALLEPMMKVEVVVPDEYMGDVMGDITSRRGRVDRHGRARRQCSRSTASCR